MERLDKAILAGLKGFLQADRAIAQKVLETLLSDEQMRAARKLIEIHDRDEKQVKRPEKLAPTPESDPARSEFSPAEERQRKREPPWIDPERTKNRFNR